MILSYTVIGAIALIGNSKNTYDLNSTIGLALASILILNIGALAQGIPNEAQNSQQVSAKIVSAAINKASYAVGEQIQLSISLRNTGNVTISDVSLLAYIVKNNVASDAEAVTVKNNIKLEKGEEKILKDLPLWQVLAEDLVTNYTVHLALLNPETNQMLDLKHNMLSFATIRMNTISSFFNDSELPSASVYHDPVFPSESEKITFNILGKDETLLTRISLFIDGEKIKEWIPNVKNFAIEHTIDSLKLGQHLYSVEVSDSSNIRIVQDLIIVIGEKDGLKILPQTGKLTIKTTPSATANAHFKLDEYDLYTDKTGEITLNVPLGSHTLQIVNEIVPVNELEQLVFKGWREETARPILRNSISFDIKTDRAQDIFHKYIFAIFGAQYKMQFTTRGLPDGSKVELSVNLPLYNIIWVNQYMTPFTFTIPKWLDARDFVDVSIGPNIVSMNGIQYLFKNWTEQNTVMSYTPDKKLSLRPINLIAVYELLDAQNALMVNLVEPRNDARLSSPVQLLAKITLAPYPLKGAEVFFYLDKKLIGMSESDEYGEASLTIESEIPKGIHKWYLRAKLSFEQSYVESEERSFVYINKEIVEISQLHTDRQNYNVGDAVLLNAVIKYIDNKEQRDLSLVATVYDSNNEPLIKKIIAHVLPTSHPEIKLNEQFLWDIPSATELGTYEISLELIDSLSHKRYGYKFTSFTIAEQGDALIERRISPRTIDTLTIDLAKSVDMNNDNVKDAVIYIDVPSKGSKLTINMTAKSDGNLQMALFGVNDNYLASKANANTKAESKETESKKENVVVYKCDLQGCYTEYVQNSSAAEQVSSNGEKGIFGGNQLVVNSTEPGVYKLYISGTYSGDSAVVSLTTSLEETTRTKIVSIEPDSDEYRKHELAKILTSLTNFETSAGSVKLFLQISDNYGNLVKEFRPIEIALDANSTKDVRRYWRIAGNLELGTYYISSVLYDMASGELYDKKRNIAQFTILDNELLENKHSNAKEKLGSNVDSIIYVKKIEHDSVLLKLVSSDKLQEHNMKKIFYASALSYIFDPFNTSIEQYPCVPLYGEEPEPAICITSDTSALTDLINNIANELKLEKYGSFVTVFEGDDENLAKESSSTGVVVRSQYETVYDLFYNGTKIATGINLPDPVEQLIIQARIGDVIYGIESNETILERARVIANYLKEGTYTKQFGEIIARNTGKYNIGNVLGTIGESMDARLYNELYHWVEYYRAQVILNSENEARTSLNDLLIKYAIDYLDRNPYLVSSLGLSEYDQVMTNVKIAMDDTHYDLDLVYLKDGKVVGILVLGTDLSKSYDSINEDLQNEIHAIFDKIINSSITMERIRITHGLTVTQFDSLKPERVLMLSTSNYLDRGFDIGIPLSSTELRTIYKSIAT